MTSSCSLDANDVIWLICKLDSKAKIFMQITITSTSITFASAKATKAELTLALKPRGDVTRNSRQGYQWPQNRTCGCDTYITAVSESLDNVGWLRHALGGGVVLLRGERGRPPACPGEPLPVLLPAEVTPGPASAEQVLKGHGSEEHEPSRHDQILQQPNCVAPHAAVAVVAAVTVSVSVLLSLLKWPLNNVRLLLQVFYRLKFNVHPILKFSNISNFTVYTVWNKSQLDIIGYRLCEFILKLLCKFILAMAPDLYSNINFSCCYVINILAGVAPEVNLWESSHQVQIKLSHPFRLSNQ